MKITDEMYRDAVHTLYHDGVNFEVPPDAAVVPSPIASGAWVRIWKWVWIEDSDAAAATTPDN